MSGKAVVTIMVQLRLDCRSTSNRSEIADERELKAVKSKSNRSCNNSLCHSMVVDTLSRTKTSLLPIAKNISRIECIT